MHTKTFNNLQFIPVHASVFESHLLHWPKIKTYTLGDDKTVTYYHDKDGMVWAAVQMIHGQSVPYVRQEMYQPLLGDDAVDYRTYKLSEVCKLIVDLDPEIDFEVEVQDKVVRIFDRHTCVARGTDREMSLNPDYDIEHREAYRRLMDLRAFLGQDTLESESPIFFTCNGIRLKYDL